MAYTIINQKSNGPIVFVNGCDAPDWRVFVFGKEFHVCSTTLRKQTTFFETLKPNGKVGGIRLSSTNNKFNGDWYTQVNKTKHYWTLTPEHKKPSKEQILVWATAKNVEQEAFQNPLCILFHQQYKINDNHVLESMAVLAETFGCVEFVSNSIAGPIKNVPGFIASLEKNTCAALKAAWKLRSTVLFRDSMALMICPWTKPQYLELENTEPHLYKLADLEHLKLSRKVLQIHQATMQLSTSFYNNKMVSFCMGLLGETLLVQARKEFLGKNILYPQYFRKLLTQLKATTDHDSEKSLRRDVLVLLGNKLVANKAAVAGEGIFEDLFLCAEVGVEDFPWVEEIKFPDYVPPSSLPAKL